MSKSKELDKFYTSPKIAEEFVDKINELFPLSSYEQVIEPAAGCGNILQFLPDNAVGMDISPEGDNIIKQDFLSYVSDSSPLFGHKRIAVVTNPPFGKGYMNPLAVKFFNKSAEFAELIAVIVPAVWHTSWKVQFQLDDSFGLYYSEVLPKNSFLLDGEEYNVNCCMQIYSKVAHPTLPDIRMRKRPPTKHVDFDMFLTGDNVPSRPLVQEQIRNNEYWDFAIKYWGNISICEIKDVPVESTSHFLIKSYKPYVRDMMEIIVKDWKKYVTAMGAPNLGGKSNLIKMYEEVKVTNLTV